MADQLEKTEKINKGENDSSTFLFEDAYSKSISCDHSSALEAKESNARAERLRLD
jgi:hypothetical protein